MAKSLLLVRHGSAEEKDPDQKDIDRELNATGLQNSSRMGRHLKDLKILPQIIISSPAIRARQSAELIAEQLEYDVGKLHINDEIYEASVRTLLQVVNQLKDDWAQVMMVGHNPTVTYLAEYITGAEIGNIETCGIVLIQFEVKSWKDVAANTGKFKQYLYPDLLEL